MTTPPDAAKLAPLTAKGIADWKSHFRTGHRGGGPMVSWTDLGEFLATIDALTQERDATRARIELLERMNREAGTHVEAVIAMRTDFSGEPPYVGWKGLGLALNEALDERDRLRTERDAARAEAAVVQRHARITKKMGSPEYRRGYTQAFTRHLLARQIRLLRGDKTQKDFGMEVGLPQNIVSRYENPAYCKWRLATLFNIADKAGLALFAKFVDDQTFLELTRDLSDESLCPIRTPGAV